MIRELKTNLSMFDVSSFGGGGGTDVSIAERIFDSDNLLNRILDLFNRISLLETKIDELYMRPQMDYTESGWDGYALYFDPPEATSRIAPSKPRWAFITDSTTTTDTFSTTTTRTNKTIYKQKQIQPYRFFNFLKTKTKNINRTIYVSGTTSTTTTTSTSTTASTTTTTSTSTTTALQSTSMSTTTSTGTLTTTTTTESVLGTGFSRKYYILTDGTWIVTGTTTTTIWTTEPGLHTETDLSTLQLETSAIDTTDTTTTTVTNTTTITT